jgi:hypothetical protein
MPRVAPKSLPLRARCNSAGGSSAATCRSTRRTHNHHCAPPGHNLTPDVLISDSPAGPADHPLRPSHRRDALPRGTLNDGAGGGDLCPGN